jgi:hypothetical protein
LKQQSELEKQTEMMRNMERQNELLLQQNRELFSKVNDIYSIVNNKTEVRKPQQVIKTIASNIKDVIDNTQRQSPTPLNKLNINIVLEQ